MAHLVISSRSRTAASSLKTASAVESRPVIQTRANLSVPIPSAGVCNNILLLQVVEGVCSLSLLIIKDTSAQHESISLGQDYSWLYAVCPEWIWKLENWLLPTFLTKQYSELSNAHLNYQDSALCSSCNSHYPAAAFYC
jgi:hypothetical protein